MLAAICFWLCMQQSLVRPEGWFQLEPPPDGRTPFAVQGWAVSPQGPPTVRVSIDGAALWEGKVFFAFPGVPDKYPNYPGAGNAGFWVLVDPTRYAEGKHSILVHASIPGADEALVGASEFTTLPPTSVWLALPLLLLLLIAIPAAAGYFISRLAQRSPGPSLPGWLIPLIQAATACCILVSGNWFSWLMEKRPGFFASLANWDGQWYLQIAREWYSPAALQRYAYFPLYPLLLKTLMVLPGPLELWGALTNLGLLAMTFLMLGKMYPGSSRGLLIYGLLPFAFFFPVLYTEALFLFLAVSFYWMLKKERGFLAFAAGALAGLTRVNAVLLILLGLGCLDRKNWKKKLAVISSPAIGLGIWCAALDWTTGDPFRFLHVQESFGRYTAFHAGRLWDNLWANLAHPGGMALWEFGALELTLILGFALLFRKRWSEGLFSLAVPLFPLATMRLISLNRYVLMAFPAFIHGGDLLKKRWVWMIVLAVEAVLLLFFAHQFARQMFVG